MKKILGITAAGAVIILLAVMAMATADPSYGPKVYKAQGGDIEVVASGGQIKVESGGDLLIETGGTLNVDGVSTIDGAINAQSTLDVDGNMIIGAASYRSTFTAASGNAAIGGTLTSADKLTVTSGGMDVVAGLARVGTGSTPGVATSNDDLFVEDAIECDGALNVGGALTLGTDLAVTEGGTGASTLTDGGILLGSGTGAVTALGVATNGQIPIGDGTTDPVLAAPTGTANQITVTAGAGTLAFSIPSTFTLPASSPTFAQATITDPLGVASGGSGAATFTDGGLLLGSGTGAFTALGVATNGQVPMGDGTTAPQLAAPAGTSNQITVTLGAASQTFSIPTSFTLPASTPTFSGAVISGGPFVLTAKTQTKLEALTPAAGDIYRCSDCTATSVVVSTATNGAAFVGIGGMTKAD